MPFFGPTGYIFELDSLNAAQDTVGAAQSLDRITEFSGITPEAVVVDFTALGDDIENEIATALRRIEAISLKGYMNTDADGAFRRIGRPAKTAEYPARTLTVTHRTGFSQAIEVGVRINKVVTASATVTMFEAMLFIMAREDADYVETGF